MRRGGIICLCVGICCLLLAVGGILYNQYDDQKAAAMSESLLQDVQAAINDNTQDGSGLTVSLQEDELIAVEGDLPTTQVDVYESIGVLSIPVLGIELPVLTDWSYAKLKLAPCVYYGTYESPNFVIAAHNYSSHFGRLSKLQPEDLIIFTDVSGTAHVYEVILIETLPPDATEEMLTSGFDLSLYTCTPGGSNRVTVRCNTYTKN